MKDKLYQARKHIKEKSTVDLGLGRLAVNKIYIVEANFETVDGRAHH
jgi:hypothetical protein